jgi:hypothetical protein
MQHRRRPMAMATAILCLLALTGCGGADETAQFKAGYASARGPLNKTFGDVARTLKGARGKSTTQIARSMGVLADRFAKKLAPLVALKPPARVTTAFTTLTSSLRRVESDLRGISGAARRRDLAGAQLAVENLATDSRAANEAATVVKQKLYAK